MPSSNGRGGCGVENDVIRFLQRWLVKLSEGGGGLAIGIGGYYGEERNGANYGDDDIGDYDDAGYCVGGNGDDYDDNDDDDAGVAIGDWKWWL